MKTVLRVEHTDGIGMFINYISDDSLNEGEWVRRKHNVYGIGLSNVGLRHSNFNNPYEDDLDIVKNGEEWFCAYKSIEQFQKWVKPEEVQVLLENNYSIYLLEVEEFQEGRDQVVFTKRGIKSKQPVNSLFKID